MQDDADPPAALPDPARPVLIAGPTASGKSALALRLARAQGRTVVNADAMQVHADWRVLTARPPRADEAAAPHRLYGHVPWGAAHSAGHWLREVAPLLAARPAPVIVGGTGLFFAALTDGLAEIPPVPDDIRRDARDRLAEKGLAALAGELDAATAGRLDLRNPARVLRAWEVRAATGRPLADWQDATPPPLLPPEAAERILLDAPKAWLTPRIAARMDAMLAGGAIEEARALLPLWDEAVADGLPATRAIGAAEIVSCLLGATTLGAARDAAVVATRRYAKRQRTWFRARMGGWRTIPAERAADVVFERR